LAPGAVMTDGVGWKDGGIIGTTYGALLSESSGTPDAATRYPSNSTPLSAAAWYNGDLLDNNDPSQTLYDTSDASTLIPAGALIGPRATAVLTVTDNDVLLNEIKVNPPGSTDAPHEWIEIKARPGVALDNIFVVSVEGDAPENIGLATAVFNLTGIAAGSN